MDVTAGTENQLQKNLENAMEAGFVKSDGSGFPKVGGSFGSDLYSNNYRISQLAVTPRRRRRRAL